MRIMDISTELEGFKARIDPRIAAYFDSVIEQSRKEDALIEEALLAVKGLALAGGKRLRPAFMYYAYLACGGKDLDRMLTTSMAVEFLHLFLLVHDDIIDHDDMRHGIPTLHRQYAAIGKHHFGETESDHFGVSIALIMGDMLMAFGNDILFRSGFPEKRVLQSLTRLQGIVSSTVIGQGQDIYMGYKKSSTESEIIRMYQNKTAKYTVEGPMHIGASLAGASEEVIRMFSRYAIPIGTAFQIRDDILGVFGAEEKLGKPVGSDIKEGKRTLLVSRALSEGTRVQGKALEGILLKGPSLSAADREVFREIIRETGSLRYCQAMVFRLVEEGRAAFRPKELGLERESSEFFFSIADYLGKREY